MTCRHVPLATAAALTGALLLSGCGGSVTPVTGYNNYNSRDGIVKCKYPKGWKQNGGKAKKFHSCAFEKGPARIRLRADIAGSAMGDVAQAAAGQMTGPDGLPLDPKLAEELAPVAQIHEMTVEQAEIDLGEIDVGTTDTVRTGFGDTRRSEISYSGTFGGTTRGYLVTALGRDHRFRLLCTCPEKHWATLKPAFEEVILSLGRGQPE